jgi:mannitol operon transcriptional antiterminator
MILFTKRQRDILTFLVNEPEVVTIKQLMAAFGVAERTIRYDLEWLESGLKERRIGLLKTAQHGIQLDFSAADGNQESLINEINQFWHRILTATERRFFILLYLLLSPQEITLQQMADRLNVSKNTVVSDIDVVDGLLKANGLQLVRRAHHGFSLSGSEKKVRNFYIKTIIDQLQNKLITKDNLVFLMKEAALESFEPVIHEVETVLKVVFSDSAKEELDISLMIVFYRLSIGKFLKTKTARFIVADVEPKIDAICQAYAAVRRIRLSNSELDYLRQIFLGAQFCYNPSEVALPYFNNDPEIRKICNNLIIDAGDYLGLDFQNDWELRSGLTTHLTMSIYRLRNNLAVSNPLTQQIRFRMPFIYEMSKKITVKYETQIGSAVPDDEIAYIAMYFGAAFERSLSSGFMPQALVVCGSGIATSGLLKTRLKIMLPELKLLGPAPEEQITTILAVNTVDFIITTAPVQVTDKEVVLVNPLLDNDDLNKIKTMIFRNTSQKQLQYLSQRHQFLEFGAWTLRDLMSSAVVQLNIECKNWQQAIAICSQPLLTNGSITEKYVTAMIKAVINYGPYIVFIPQIALAHAAPDRGVNRECLSMATLKYPLYFGDKNKELVKIVIVFGALGQQLESLYRLTKIFENNNNIALINQAQHYEEIGDLSGQ